MVPILKYITLVLRSLKKLVSSSVFFFFSSPIIIRFALPHLSFPFIDFISHPLVTVGSKLCNFFFGVPCEFILNVLTIN